MRKALIGIIMTATVLTPIAAQAQDSDRTTRIQQRYERQAARNQARSDARQQRQEVRQQRVQAPQAQGVEAVQRPERTRVYSGGDRQQSDAARQNRRAWRDGTARQNDGSRVTTQSGQSTETWRDRRSADREAFRNRVQETREASRRSAEGLPDQYQRQAERNQARSEERMRERYRDERREWREDRREWRQDRRDLRHARNWDRQWRNDRRYDWQSYRYSNRNLFRIGRYYAPYRNHSYNRLSIGLFLGSGFYGDNYWINDPWQYRLPPAYPGTRWVRYYDDVLLVDVYTGEVVDVIYDFFW